MTFTYTGDLTQSLDYVRFKINDKVEEYAIYQDEEINYFISQISGTPTSNDLDKVALDLLKQQLQEIMRGPSRERSGAYEVYAAQSDSLRLAISELEKEIKKASPPSIFTSGIYKSDVCANRDNDALVQSDFDKDEFFNKECIHPNDDGRVGY